LGDTKLDFPVAYDWEIIKDEEARTDKVTPAQATECARAFCQEAASYGYTPMIYSTSRELYFKYDLTKLANYDIWYCEYANTPEFYYQFSMWQYSETGKVDGIEGNVDLNICFTGVAKYAE
ncbi:MAG: GH25 family lysozyme, partial [Alphaproteobacteria bacterium]